MDRGILKAGLSATLLVGAMPFSVRASGETLARVSQLTRPRRIPPGTPKHSDVTMRSLTLRPQSVDDPHDTFGAAQAFHVTRLDWVYVGGTDIQRIRSQGYHATATVHPGLGAMERQAQGNTTEVRLVDLDREVIVPPHFEDMGLGCANSPVFRRLFLEKVKALSEAGAEAIQVDDPELNAGYVGMGCCFCGPCLRAFAGYLRERATADELQDWGIADVSRFDFRQYLRDRDAPAGAAFAGWDGGPEMNALRRHFHTFQVQSTCGFYEWLFRETRQSTATHVAFSLNNFNGSWSAVAELFDFGMAEVRAYNANAPTMHRLYQRASERGKSQVFTVPKESPRGNDYPTIDIALNRRYIAFGYACGHNVLLPWDVCTRAQPAKEHRHFGKPEDYADLSGFIRANANLLDGYEDAAAIGNGLQEDRYGDSPPLAIDGRFAIDVYATVRARPNDRAAPVVVHLVDWSTRPEPFSLGLRPARLFGAHPLRVSLLVPTPYGADTHSRAEETKDYSALSKTVPLAGGYVTSIRVPALSPWGLLVIEPGRPDTGAVWAPVVQPMGGFVIEPVDVTLSCGTPGATIRFTTDGSDPTSHSELYTGPFVLSAGAQVRARAFRGERASPVSEAIFETASAREPENPEEANANGLRYQIFVGEWDAIPDFDQLMPVKTGTASGFDLGPMPRDGRASVAMRFEGFIEVPRSGKYRFDVYVYNNPVGHCRLFIGDILVDERPAGSRPRREGIFLRAGKHAIRADHFHGDPGNTAWLMVRYEGPGVGFQTIGESVLFHTAP